MIKYCLLYGILNDLFSNEKMLLKQFLVKFKLKQGYFKFLHVFHFNEIFETDLYTAIDYYTHCFEVQSYIACSML